MKLIVGLGNPGRKYAGTRHNVGWQVLAELAKRHGQTLPQVKFRGELVEARIQGEKTLLLCPHTYMNCSGDSVQPAKDYYRIETEDLIVVCDDFNLPLARIRFRAKGTAGGQKGLTDVIRRLGTDQFPRLRIGVGSPPPEWDAADFVLSKFTNEESEAIDTAIARSADGLADWVSHGIAYCMNEYNGT